MPSGILLISESRISTVRHVEQLGRHISKTSGVGFRSVTIADLRPSDFAPEWVPLIVRGDSHAFYILAVALNRARIPYIYFLDDNFWELDPSTELGAYYRSNVTVLRLERIIGGAETVLVSTHALREYLSRFGDKVHQVNAFFDYSLIPALPPQPDNRGVVRGGFAGSTHRAVDLLPIMADVVDVLEERPEFEFEVIGVDPELLPDHPRIRYFPYLDSYESYIAFQIERQWDFGLAPLSDAPANRYKTNNKYREYSAQGIPGVYSDALPYAEIIDLETGVIAGPRRSWREAIELYVDSAELRGKVREQARRDGELGFSLPAVSHIWERHIERMPLALSPAVPLDGAVRRAHMDLAVRAFPYYWVLGALRVFVDSEGISSTLRRVPSAFARMMAKSSRRAWRRMTGQERRRARRGAARFSSIDSPSGGDAGPR